jgi:cell division protein FtsL
VKSGYALELMAEKPKDPVAQAMVEKRWAKTSAKQRSEIAVKMNEARWAKKKAKKMSRKTVSKPERGTGLLEIILLIALVVILVMVFATVLAAGISGEYHHVADAFEHQGIVRGSMKPW